MRIYKKFGSRFLLDSSSLSKTDKSRAHGKSLLDGVSLASLLVKPSKASTARMSHRANGLLKRGHALLIMPSMVGKTMVIREPSNNERIILITHGDVGKRYRYARIHDSNTRTNLSRLRRRA